MRLLSFISARPLFCPQSGEIPIQWSCMGTLVLSKLFVASLSHSEYLWAWSSIGVYSRTSPPVHLITVDSHLSV